jgi:hypothetical protein
MAVIFLIGGTGNQFFQIANAAESDKFSDFFLRPFVCKLLGWSAHEKLVSPEHPSSVVEIYSLALLFFDLLFKRFFKMTVFSELDLRKMKSKPSFRCLVKMGYFQGLPNLSGINRVRRALKVDHVRTEEHRTVLHIRGGDLRIGKAAKQNSKTYGLLSEDYYLDCINKFRQNDAPIAVVTNDEVWAKSLACRMKIKDTVILENKGLRDFCSLTLGCDVFIAGNSTLSWWICLLRGPDKVSVAPDPFFMSRDFFFPEYIKRLPAKWSVVD